MEVVFGCNVFNSSLKNKPVIFVEESLEVGLVLWQKLFFFLLPIIGFYDLIIGFILLIGYRSRYPIKEEKALKWVILGIVVCSFYFLNF